MVTPRGELASPVCGVSTWDMWAPRATSITRPAASTAAKSTEAINARIVPTSVSFRIRRAVTAHAEGRFAPDAQAAGQSATISANTAAIRAAAGILRPPKNGATNTRGASLAISRNATEMYWPTGRFSISVWMSRCIYGHD
jgi:hypothetical protein